MFTKCALSMHNCVLCLLLGYSDISKGGGGGSPHVKFSLMDGQIDAELFPLDGPCQYSFFVLSLSLECYNAVVLRLRLVANVAVVMAIGIVMRITGGGGGNATAVQ